MVTARPVSISFVSWFVDWSYRNRATLAALFICLIAGSGFLSYLAKANEDPSAGLGSERVESVARESVPASDPTASDRGAPDSAPTSVAAFADDGDGDTPSGVAGKPGGSENRTGDVSADAVSMKSVVVETAGTTSSTTTTAPPTTTTTAPPTTTTTAPPTTTTTGPTTTSTTATKPTVIGNTTTSTDDDDDGDDDDDDDGGGDDDQRLATDLSVGRQGGSGGEDEFADWLASLLGDTRRR